MGFMRSLFILTLVFTQAPAIAEHVPGSASSATNDNLYNQKVFELSGILYGVIEIGGKSCKATGEHMASSLDGWWNSVGAYQKGEASLSATLNKRHDELQQKMQHFTDDKNAEMQVDAFQIDIDSMDAAIESISGPGGRIPLRQSLLVSVDEAIKKIEQENAKNVAIYNNMTQKVYDQVMAAAKSGCERKKKVKKCTKDDKGVESCATVEEKDPVPGCEAALAAYPELQAGSFKKYREIYFKEMPSSELNAKMAALEEVMKTTVESIPHSNDANYDWSTSMEKAVADVTKSRKDSGIICPSSTSGSSSTPEKVSSAAQSFLSSIGTTNLSANVKSTFTDSWNIADTVVGQPGLRPAYFNYVKDRIGEIISMDEASVASAITTRANYTKYASSVKSISSTGSSVSSPVAADTSTKNSDTPMRVGGAQSAVTIGSSSPLLISPAAKLSNSGNFSVNNSQVKSNTATLLGNRGAEPTLGQNAVARRNGTQIDGNFSTRSTLIDNKLESNKQGNSENNKKEVKKIDRKKDNVFAGPNSLSNDMALDRMNKLIGEKVGQSFNSLNNTPGANELYKEAVYHSIRREQGDYRANSYEANSGNINAKEKKSEYKNNYKPIVFAKSNDKTPVVKTSKIKKDNHDSEILAQAIKAKNEKKLANAYNATEDDSLFGIITKAYIRNYEKVDNSATEEE
ncbi:MAG: hypothetical protein H7336_14870 [Bacteriovorax sp.]|nr:hypothetical protein [Bacteriovorax sp.]